MHFKNGKVAYSGEWQNDQFHGFGTLFNEFPGKAPVSMDFYFDFGLVKNNWVKFEGDFRNDQRSIECSKSKTATESGISATTISLVGSSRMTKWLGKGLTTSQTDKSFLGTGSPISLIDSSFIQSILFGVTLCFHLLTVVIHSKAVSYVFTQLK